MTITEVIDDGEHGREAHTTLGAFVNCPSCMAMVFGVLVGLWLRFLPAWPVYCLAIVGGGMATGHWWMSQRVKAKWWE